MNALPADEGIVASIVNPAQVWHLARLAAAREALAHAPRISPGDAAAGFDAVATHLQAIADQSWQQYVQLVAMSPAEREAYVTLGQPSHITLNTAEGAPVAQWNSNNPATAGVFGELVVPGEDGSFSHHISDAFRPVDVTSLPEGRVLLPLNDTRHTAVAAVHEITALLARDLDRIIRGVEPADAWRAMLSHGRFLKGAATETLSYLPEDHYRGWNTKLTAPAGLQQTAMLVDQHAGTTTAQQRIALFYVASCFTDLMARAEREQPENAGRRCMLVRERLSRDLLVIRQMLDGHNATAAATLGLVAEQFHGVVFFRAVGHSKPVYAAIPKSQVQPPAAIGAA